MTVMSGADALVESLARQGVEVVYGIPGVQIMSLVDAFYRHGGIRWITPRHEQTAAYMAYGYARSSGKPGVAVVVPGPGALNATAALGTAYAASTPVLLISGQIESRNIGKNRGILHEVDDLLDVFKPLTKWNHRATQVSEVPGMVNEAMRRMKEGRPRPVEIEFPPDILTATADIDLPELPEPVVPRGPKPDQVKEAAAILASATHPVIWAGGGAIEPDASKEVTMLAERLNAPVVTTDEGKGVISDRHPLSLGNASYGTKPILPQADVIFIVGSRFNLSRLYKWTPQPEQTIIQVDIDPREAGRNKSIKMGIVADARLTINALLKELPAKPRSAWQISGFEAMQTNFISELEKAIPTQIALLRTLREELPDNAVVVSGVTNLGSWSSHVYPVYEPRTYITSSYFGTLGYAFPTALGAKCAHPDRPVVALSGDGGFLYAAPELSTAVQEGINVIALVFNDGAYNAVMRMQENHFGGRIMGTTIQNPDFAKLAESYHALGIKLSGPEELRDGLRTALAANRPTVIDIPLPSLVNPWETMMD